MSGFVVNSSHNRYFAISEIVEFDTGKLRASGFGHFHTAKLRDGTEILLDSYEADQLIARVTATIPAQPGYSTIETGNCVGGEPYTIRETVLAWQILMSGEVRPITIRGPNNGENYDIAVEQPTGEIWMPALDAIYPTFDEFRESELERRAQEEADRAERRRAKAEAAK